MTLKFATIMATKEQEIKAIKALADMNGYFAECFKDDIEMMIRNIRNDHPIEMGTHLADRAEYFQQRGDELVKQHALEILDLCDTLLCVNAETGNARLYERAVEKIGQLNVIQRKRAIGLDITVDEIDFLLKNVSL